MGWVARMGNGYGSSNMARNGDVAMRGLALAQGAFNLAGGLWPLLSMRTFEAVYGPKSDKWLEYTVAGLLVTIGTTQILSRREKQVQLSRVLGIGTAGTLLAVDLINVPKGRISRMYLQDAVCEMVFLAAWARRARQPS
jgi:hypothetical protein